MATATHLLTAEEFEQHPSSRWAELVDGVVIELMPPGGLHGIVAARISTELCNFVRPRHLGVVLVEGGFTIRRGPDTVRGPDVSFVRAERVPPTGVPRGFWAIAPDLVVEIISPSNTRPEVQTKIREHLEAGVPLVWSVDPDARTVEVVRSLHDRMLLSADDIIDGGDVIVGFSCKLSDLFE
ncbi:MAG: hypothetical protein HW416_1585 [Chloroflexi bacterium]|nr:hypothetical protein [Chloroflexota bacterium]